LNLSPKLRVPLGNSLEAAMTDNLEQLEKDWPQRRPKDLKSFLLFAIMITGLDAAIAVLVILDMNRRHAHLWYIYAFSLAVGISGPWLGAIGAYRRIKAIIIASGGSPIILLSIRQNGATALYMTYLAIMMILMSTGLARL
jgi:hypothetical protein